MDISEFEKDRTIDPNQLDLECVRQADIFFKWAERAVTARSNADRLQLVLDVTEARLQAEVRRAPEKFDIDKMTEAGVKAAVYAHEKYVEAYDALLGAKEDSAMLDKAVLAMEIKKRMLESLITLAGQQYFAGPGTPRNLAEEYHKHQMRVGESVNARQKAQARKRVKGSR